MLKFYTPAFAILILLLSSPQYAYATEPGVIDILFGFFVVFLCLVVLPIILIGLGLRKISPNKDIELGTPIKAETKIESNNEVKLDTSINQEKKNEIDLGASVRPEYFKGFLLISIAVIVFLGPFLSRMFPILRMPYDIVFMTIFSGFPILLLIALLCFLLSVRKRKNKT